MDCIIDIIGESVDTNNIHTYLVLVQTQTLEPADVGVRKVTRQTE